MTLLDARDIRKSIGNRTLLDGVSLAIDEGERVGLVGKNGSGKSTLARILAGGEPPDGGTLARRRGARMGYLEQVPTFDPEATVWTVARSGLDLWEDAKRRYDEATLALERGEAGNWLEKHADAQGEIERLGGWEPDHRVRSYLQHLGVAYEEKRMRELSGGEQRRVALARLLVSAPDLAILDEPTNHLDADTVEWLEGHLVDVYRGAVLFVTHDRYFLDRIVTRTLELERGLVYAYDGGYEEYLLAKAEREEREAKTEATRRNFVRRELEWLRRTPAARTGKQKARIDRAEAAIATKGPERDRGLDLAYNVQRSGRTLLELKGLGIDVAGRTLIDSLDLSITRGERLGIVGPNGAGKSTFLRVISGERPAERGEIVKSSTVKAAVLDQGRSGLDESQSILDAVADGALKIEVGGQKLDVRGYLEGFLFDSRELDKKVGALSGGERARVLVARMLLQPASLLVLDEPTNDLDLPTLSAIEDLLVRFEGTAIVVTHDRYFLDRVATSLLVFEDGTARRYAGNYTMYRALRREEEARREAAAREANEASERKRVSTRPEAREVEPAKKTKGLTYGERLELEGILPKIDEAETRVRVAEAALEDPELYTKRGHEVPAKNEELVAAKSALEALMSRWELLEAKKAG